MLSFLFLYILDFKNTWEVSILSLKSEDKLTVTYFRKLGRSDSFDSWSRPTSKNLYHNQYLTHCPYSIISYKLSS